MLNLRRIFIVQDIKHILFIILIFDQEASLEFEKKDAPVYLNVNYSEGGSVRVDNKLISSGVSFASRCF